jgi:hypothetical protein
MKYKKDNHKETIIIEVAAWLFILVIIYMFAQAIF